MSQTPGQLWWTEYKNAKGELIWKKVDAGLFDVEPKEKQSGYVPFTFGVVVKVPNPRYETFFYVGSGPVFVASGGYERMFDCILDKGNHTAVIITRTSEKHPETPNDRRWRRVSIDVEVGPRNPSKMGIISNFFQTKAAGQYIPNTPSTGLDVAFSISVKENPKTLEWFFDEQGDPTDKNHVTYYWPDIPQHYSEDYSYKEKGVHTGYVKVTDSKGRPAGECRFSVVIGDNTKL